MCAICAAPFLVGRLGYFKDKHFTVHPGFEGDIIGGTYDRDKGVVISHDNRHMSREFTLLSAKILSEKLNINRSVVRFMIVAK